MWIKLEELKLQVSLGVFDWEKEKPREVDIALALRYDASRAAESDDIKDALDYALIERTLLDCCGARHYDLVETLVAEIGKAMLAFPSVEEAHVEIGKPGALEHAGRVSVSETFTRKGANA